MNKYYVAHFHTEQLDNSGNKEKIALLSQRCCCRCRFSFFLNNNFCVCEQMFYARREVPFFSIAYEICDTHGTNPFAANHPSFNELCTQGNNEKTVQIHQLFSVDGYWSAVRCIRRSGE